MTTETVSTMMAVRLALLIMGGIVQLLILLVIKLVTMD